MATLAAALLLFPLSARGKKRGKRKPDASTVAASMQYHQRGTMAHVHGDIDGAKQAFREAIKLKPDFAYAYYRLGFVMHEQAQQEKLRRQKEDGPLRPTEDPVPVFRQAIRLDGRDEMYYYSLGQALKDQLDLLGAVDTFSAVTRFNPRSAQAYWALGKVHAETRDEFDSDPDDPDDPSHFYEIAARLKPDTFFADGSRIRLIEPMTPEREAALAWYNVAGAWGAAGDLGGDGCRAALNAPRFPRQLFLPLTASCLLPLRLVSRRRRDPGGRHLPQASPQARASGTLATMRKMARIQSVSPLIGNRID